MGSPAEIYGQDVAAIFFPSPFFPSPFQNGTARTLYVRAQGPAGPLAPAIRDIVAQIDPRVPLLELATLDEKIRSDVKFQFRRVLAGTAAMLGIVALGGSAALLALAMLLASILPAAQAARLDPNLVLREE